MSRFKRLQVDGVFDSMRSSLGVGRTTLMTLSLCVLSGVAKPQALHYRGISCVVSANAEYPKSGQTLKIRHHATRFFSPSHSAFSLIELLITVTLILILTTLYFGPNNANRQQALKQSCQKNLQKIFVSMEIYANEHSGQFPNVPGARSSEEALDVLVPKYTSDTSPFICPGSKDSALPPAESFRSRKISYAYYMGRGLTNSDEVLLSDRQVDTQSKNVGQDVFSTNGKAPGNNHRKFGGNFLFCDGHAEMSPAIARIPLLLTNLEVLLNP